MLVTVLGIVNVPVMPEPSKAEALMVVRLLGSVSVYVSFSLGPPKLYSPTNESLLGNVIEPLIWSQL